MVSGLDHLMQGTHLVVTSMHAAGMDDRNSPIFTQTNTELTWSIVDLFLFRSSVGVTSNEAEWCTHTQRIFPLFSHTDQTYIFVSRYSQGRMHKYYMHACPLNCLRSSSALPEEYICSQFGLGVYGLNLSSRSAWHRWCWCGWYWQNVRVVELDNTLRLV